MGRVVRPKPPNFSPHTDTHTSTHSDTNPTPKITTPCEPAELHALQRNCYRLSEAEVSAICHDVLFSPDLWPVLFPSLDRASKVALRCANRAMRAQVDPSIKVVASPVSGFSPDALSAALVRCTT
ncbi:hypothetical protein FOA52_009849 [Chlamydomonas sp. UWO 241]|nr:hypothetical protein FOA52_009849 [Chlamydomonas sp. UWO 241]